MAERGVHVDHSTLNRWVLKDAPELDKRLRTDWKPTNDSWRVDETSIEIKGAWQYFNWLRVSIFINPGYVYSVSLYLR